MIIREAKTADARELAELNTITWKHAYKGLMPDDFLASRTTSDEKVAKYVEMINNKAEIFLTAEHEGKLFGFLWAGKAKSENPPCESELYAIYVLPSLQKLGAGSALMAEYKKRMSGKSFFLFMLKGNENAAHFYEKCGGILKPEYEKDFTRPGFTLRESMYFFKN